MKIGMLIRAYYNYKQALPEHFEWPLSVFRIAKMSLPKSLRFILLMCLMFSAGSQAMDIVKISAPSPKKPVGEDADSPSESARVTYKIDLVSRILKKTEKQFGPYDIRQFTIPMNRFRAFEELHSGENLNLYHGSESILGNSSSIVVPTPSSRGILNYRLLIVHRDNLEKFNNINSLEDLKRFTTTARPDWSTSTILESYGIKVSYSHSYDGMFNLLKHKRVDYILRAVPEALRELERRQDFNELTIVPVIAVVIPLPTYFHVSPSEPELAKRIDAGLQAMQADGELREVFDHYYKQYLQDAKMCERTLIYLDPADKARLEQLGDAVYRPCEELQ